MSAFSVPTSRAVVAEAIELADGTTRIGCAPDSDVVLDHPSVDPHHAEIVSSAEGVRLRDLSVRGGTRLNGQLVVGAVLADGDELSIGDFSWAYRARRLVPVTLDEPPLRAVDVTVRVGGTTLLEPTSLVVAEGELLAIIGPSGAGKSTLLHVLAGLRTPTSGQVLMRGSDVGVRQEDLGFVPQDDAVHGRLTAREALRFAARLRLPEDEPSSVHEAAVERVLGDVDLAAAADRRIGRLSGGQRKRVALAQELICEPTVLLLDEPTSGLDPGLEHRMMQLMRRLATGARSVVVVTHTVGHLGLCDRIAVMAPGGRLAALGTAEEVLASLGAATFEQIFDRLETADDEPDEAPGPTQAAPAATTPETPLPPPERPRPATGRVQVRRRRVRAQAHVLTRRYALLMLRDRRNLRLLLTQALGLSAGAALLFGHDVFRRGGGLTLHAGATAQLLFLMVTMAIWFGAITAARQVVAERNVLARELSTGVRTEAYLLSKALVLGAVAAAQTILMSLIVFTLRPIGGGPGQAQTVVLVLVLCSWAGVGFGLVVSAFARSEDQASSFIPLVLLPQLLFGGALVPLAQLSAPMVAVSYLAAARWGFAAVGHAVDMNGRIATDPVFASASRYGPHFFSLGTLVAGLVLALFGLACATVLQAHLRPSFEDTWWQQMRFRLRERLEDRQEGTR